MSFRFSVSLRRPVTPLFQWLCILLTSVLAGSAELHGGLGPIDPALAEQEGRRLVAQLLATVPSQPLNSSGVVKTRAANGTRTEIPVRFQIIPQSTNWLSVYEVVAAGSDSRGAKLTVVSASHQPNTYLLDDGHAGGTNAETRTLTGNEAMIPFAGSDFWLADLGLEFLHWPKQRLLKKEIRRGQSCYVLESTNPRPATEIYSRVVSWLDIDSVRDAGEAAIVHAEAFDSEDRLLKEFDPKEFKKVGGEWQLQEMEIGNRQTGSRTRIVFDLGAP